MARGWRRFSARAVRCLYRRISRCRALLAGIKGVSELIHTLLVIAAILLVLWFLFHATGALVNLIWIAIVVLVSLWLVGMVRGRGTAP